MSVRGVYPPIATPFDRNGHLDQDALAANVARWNTTGLSGYVVAGSNGESALLDEDEIADAVRVVRGAARPESRVIVGAGRESTRATARLIALSAEAGADLALVVNPAFYGGQMTEEVLVRHYSAVADASPIPVIVYNVPKHTHLNIPVPAVVRMAGHPNIVGIKDSAGDIAQLIELVRLCRAGFSVLVGNAPAFLGGLQVGASGGVLALANVAPAECVAVQRLMSEGRPEEARSIHFRMMPVGRAVTSQFGVPGLKAALDMLGFRGGDPRPPLMPLDPAARETLAAILYEAGLVV